LRLCAQIGRGGRRFLDHGRILLRDLVHLVHRGVHLAQARGLFLRRLRDLGDEAVDLGDLADDARERLTFAFAELEAPRQAAAGQPVRLAFTVANTGARAGSEVAQVYVRLLAIDGSLARPPSPTSASP